jgi:ATP-dependent exoDNAse (exonuclease V) beta subunit
VKSDFFSLDAQVILDSVEDALAPVFGGRATGRILALNSLENRVHEIEWEDGRKFVSKFYRPNRWNEAQLREEHLFLEMEFSYAMEDGRMKGFIDAVCFFNGAYYILDWKTNYLGMDRQSYSKETVEAAMGQSGYFMQASIYQEALMRYLTLFDKRPFTQIFGGAIYLFMRGPFCYHFMPQPASTWQVGKEVL